MSRILVTGGTGFIGSHTAALLLEQGHEVVLFDNLSNSKVSAVDGIERACGRRPEFVRGDIRDGAALEELFRRRDAVSAPYDAVIHFAGLKAVGESVKEPERYHENNVEGSLKLYKAMAAAGVKKIIFSSSATVYGPDNRAPYTEDMPLAAVNPYGETKILNELALRALCGVDPGWTVMLLRYFNPGGAHPGGFLGEDPGGIPNNLLPYVAKVAAGELKEIQIFGDDYYTPDGTGVRDYIHVMDVARGHVLALEWLFGGHRAEAVNLGTGRGTSVREIIRAFEAACGKELPAAVCARRAGDLACTYADVSLAKELLGFEAEYGIEDICRDGWRWQQSISVR